MTRLLRPPNYIRYDAVLDALRDGPLTVREIAAKLGLGYDTVLYKLHAAWDDDRVERSPKQPHRWSL